MNRRDFINAFSAGTTLAAATSLADIVEAKPVINNLENRIILPGDKGFNTDWVFDYVAYFRHEYGLSNKFEIVVDVPDYFYEILEVIEGNRFKFTFKLEDDYFFRYAKSGLTADPLSSYIEEFLETHTFEVGKNDIEFGERFNIDNHLLIISNMRTIEGDAL